MQFYEGKDDYIYASSDFPVMNGPIAVGSFCSEIRIVLFSCEVMKTVGSSIY